jgi:integrase
LEEAKVTTKEARKKLGPGVHWRGIDPNVHLGYRKGKRGGSWLVRWYLGNGRYRQQPLGVADDELSEGTLDYNGAVKAAKGKVDAARLEAKANADGPLLTVRRAVEAYIAERDRRDTARKGREVRSDARSRLGRYVVGVPARGKRKTVPPSPLANIPLHALDEVQLQTWRSALPATLKAATKQRLINDLKAALNEAYATNRKRLPVTVPSTIKHALRSTHQSDESDDPARDNQILTDGQVGRLIGAAREIDAEQGWDGDLFRMVAVLAATGARFSQVSRLRVADMQPSAGRLIVPVSRKGKGKRVGSVPVPIGGDIVEALLPAITGRPKDAPLLERWRSKQVSGAARWERTGRGPWQSPSELNRAWNAARKRAELPEVIPYAFRHSSIIRGIRANLPIRLVAALHDTSVAMIERHYGRFIADGLDELAARSVVPLVPVPTGDNVTRLRTPGAK